MEESKTSDERLAAICQMIRNETLEPALQEAEQIKQIAEREAARIRTEAKLQADTLLRETRHQVAQEKHVFEASLHQAAAQAVSILKEKIETSLLNQNLDYYASSEFHDSYKVGTLLDLLIKNISKEGLDGDLEISIGSSLNKEEIVAHLLAKSLKDVSKGDFVIKDTSQGIVLRMKNKKVTVEITPSSIKELLSSFIRHDFRRFLFQEA